LPVAWEYVGESLAVKSPILCITSWAALLILSWSACGEDTRGPSGGEQTEIQPSKGFVSRQAEYLSACSDQNGPGRGGIHGQVCRAYTAAGTFNEEAIRRSVEKINRREDTADFDFNSLIRVLYFDRRRPTLPPGLREEMKQAVLNFKYWPDEPGPDTMCFWSENHQILFHAAELLAGQLYPDEPFPNADLYGRERVEHALPRAMRWLDLRGRFGFSEWHSNVYFNEDIPPLVNLVDFAEDETLRTKAAMVLDLIAFDMACNYYKGCFATTHGRTYQRSLGEGIQDSTREAAYILLGLGAPENTNNFSGALLATSEAYAPPPLLERIAAHASDRFEHRQRDSIDLEEGPAYGIGTRGLEDVMFWWGLEGYAAPTVITGSFDVVEQYDMWGGFFWGGVPFLRVFVGSPLLEDFARTFEDMTRGVLLERVDTYTYRSPHYQLSGAQDFKPGMWAAQVHVWQATLDRDAYVFTSYPGGLEDDYMAGPWTGGFLPRATFHRNVGVIQYRRVETVPSFVDKLLFTDYSHAFFPRSAFDEVEQTGHWTFGRKGNAYVALYSDAPTTWSTENDYELIADARENVWIVELGDREADGPFAAFMSGVEAAAVSLTDDRITYLSPSRGRIEVGWNGSMTVEGAPVDLGPYDRWDNPHCTQAFGETTTTITHEASRLHLDFQQGTRVYQSRDGT
jgi:hypothetical protein